VEIASAIFGNYIFPSRVHNYGTYFVYSRGSNSFQPFALIVA